MDNDEIDDKGMEEETTFVARVLPSIKVKTPEGDIELFVSGDEIPEGTSMEDIIAVLIEKSIKYVDTIGPEPEIEATPEPEPEPEPESNLEQEEDKPDKKPRILGLIGIGLIPLIFAGALNSCNYSKMVEGKVVRHFTIGIEEVNGPQDNVLGVIGESGQEGLHNNVVAGEPNAIEGEDYSGEEHFRQETESATGLEDFRASRDQVRENLSELTNPDLTPSEVKARLDSIERETEKMKDQYTSREELIDQGAKDFERRTLENEDEISQDEIGVVGEMRDTFYREEGQVSDTLEEIHEVQERVDAGEKIQIDSVEIDEDKGRHLITGKTIETVVKEQKFSGIRAAWEALKDYIRELVSGHNKNENQR